MNEQKINVAIAESFGIEILRGTSAGGRMGRKKGWGDGDWKLLPNYCRDLNAMQSAEDQAGQQTIKAMRFWLYELTDQMTAHHSTARQRAEAFLRVKGLWQEPGFTGGEA